MLQQWRFANGSPPRLERSGASTVRRDALKVEGIVDGGMHAEEALGGSRRLEALHLALSSSHRLMRLLLLSACS
jgi:hypothetical protein